MKYLKNKLEIGHGEIVLALGVAGLYNYYRKIYKITFLIILLIF